MPQRSSGAAIREDCRRLQKGSTVLATDCREKATLAIAARSDRMDGAPILELIVPLSGSDPDAVSIRARELFGGLLPGGHRRILGPFGVRESMPEKRVGFYCASANRIRKAVAPLFGGVACAPGSPHRFSGMEARARWLSKRGALVVFFARVGDGFEFMVRWGECYHCPHEEAVLRRMAEWFRLPLPKSDRSAQLRADVRSVSIVPIENGYYVAVNGNRVYVSTAEIAMQKIKALFDGSNPPAAAAGRTVQSSPAVTFIEEKLAEAKRSLLTLEERVQAFKVEYGPTPEQLTIEEAHLDELLGLLKQAIDAGWDLLHGALPSAWSENGGRLVYIRNQLTDLHTVLESWIAIRQHPGSMGNWQREQFERFAARAAKHQEASVRRWARSSERRERREEVGTQ